MVVDIFVMILYSAYAMSDDSPFLTKRKRDRSADISVFSKGRKPFPDLCMTLTMTGFSLSSQVSSFLKKTHFQISILSGMVDKKPLWGCDASWLLFVLLL